MPGGGDFQLQPGQVTDDSELAMCQLRGLLAGEGKFDRFHLCLYYGHWVHLGPFDIGHTTANGLGAQLQCLDNPNPELSRDAANFNARDASGKSMSNGSMMKLTPLAVWSQNLGLDELD